MKKIFSFLILLLLITIVTSCKKNKNIVEEQNDGVYYQIFVRSFADSDGDGVGDINGVTENLDYLSDLGVSGIWLMPIFPSDSYHGYDVKDYYTINPEYGSMDDFNRLISEANKRNIKVILDLVLNHTSTNHEWFIDASTNPDSMYRDYYYWIDKNDYRVEKAAPSGERLWHKLGDKYYASSFPGNYADLNYLNKAVEEEAINIAKFWMDKGVAGFRLDAAMYLFLENKVPFQYNYRHGIIFWSRFRESLRKINPDVHLIGEVWSHVMTYSQYYDGLDSTFNFNLSDIIIDVVRRGNGSYSNQLNQVYKVIKDRTELYMDSPFLRNHDMNRVANELQGDISKMKLAAEMLLTLPGNPYIYYGEEIGMFGESSSGIGGIYDETRRLPFVWGNEEIETTWMDEKCKLSNISCEQNIDSALKQMKDENSLYNVYKTLINLRKKYKVLYNGDFLPYDTNKITVQGYFRYNDEDLFLVIHNLGNNIESMPQFEKAKLIYQSQNANLYESGKIDKKSTIILELPYEDLEKYIQ